MQGRIKKIFSSVLCALVVLSFLAQPMCTMAAEVKNNVSTNERQFVDIVINPEYADILDVEALRAELDEIKAFRDQASTDVASTVYTTVDAAAAELRAEMVKRNTTIELKLTDDLYNSVGYSGIFNAAIAYSDACSGQEGDALARVWSGYRIWLTDVGSTQILTFDMEYMTTYEQEQELTKAVDAAINSLNMENDDDYTKVYKIYNYICDNVDYDYEHLEDKNYLLQFTAYAALCNKTAVCQGYAVLFYRMCKEVGLSVRYINGYGNGGRHAWNIVKIGDCYYNLDSTWDGQESVTYDNYFLKNMIDFADHQRHDEFLTEDFMRQYPMSNFSWRIPQKLNAPNLYYVFNTIEDSTVSLTADGRPKVLIFYSETCSNSQNTVKSISETSFPNVDIVTINANMTDKETVKAFKESYGNDSIVFAYDPSYIPNYFMWEYVDIGGLNGAVYPVIAYIDSNDIVRHVACGYTDAETISYNLNFYCGESGLSVGETSKTLNAGDTYKIKAHMNNAEVNNRQIQWNSSNAEVATVNANGVVTAIGGGTCTITGKLNETYSVSMNVTVIKKLDVPQFTVENTSGGVQVNWNFVDDATGYIVYRREAGGTFKKIAGFTDGKTKSYIDKTVVNGTTYFYAVKAINSTSQSEYTTKGITYKAMLETPTFTVTNASGGVQIKWNFVADATGYIIYRREAGGTFSKIASFTDGVTKSYVDKNVVDGKAYFYAVKAVNSTTQSAYTTKGINYKASLAAPTFTVANAGNGVQIKWDFVDGATGYIVYRREAGGVFQKIAGFTDGKTKSYTDKNVVNGTAYFYAVKAINGTTQSEYTTKGINYKASLATPSFTIANVAGGVQIKWEFVENAIGYIIYRREAGGTFSKIAGFTDGKTKSYVDTNVVDGKAYFYAVKAVNNTTQSTYNTQGINYKASLAAPTFTVTKVTDGVQVDWNFVDGATGYIVYRRETNGTFSKIAGFTDGKTKSYIDKTAVKGTTYYYAVKAINSSTQSTYNSVQITP